MGSEGDPVVEQAGGAILAALEKAVAEGRTGPCHGCPRRAQGVAHPFQIAGGRHANGTNPLPLLDELRELGECTIVTHLDELPVLAELVPTECYLYWDVTLIGDISREDIEDVFIFVIDDMELVIAPWRRGATAPRPITAPEQPRPPKHPLATHPPPMRPRQAQRIGQESVRVAAERLDELMNRVGELVIAQSRLAQLAGTKAGRSDPAHHF
jgi:two-component system chemotaxis sensor kinase CheA